MKFTPITTFVFSIMLLTACGEDSVKDQVKKVFLNPHSPATRNILTQEDLIRYKQLSSALITFNERYIDVIKQAPVEDQPALLKNLRTAKDELARKFKFRDFNEYLWIDTAALKNPVNRDLAGKIGIHLTD